MIFVHLNNIKRFTVSCGVKLTKDYDNEAYNKNG